MSALREHLQARCAALTEIGYPSLMDRFILERGVDFTGSPLPKGWRRALPKQCFANAGRIVIHNSRTTLIYHEGYVIGERLPIPIHHAWIVDEHGRVIDTTLREPEKHEYLGVPFRREIVLRELNRHRIFGLLDRGVKINVELIYEMAPELRAVVEKIMAKHRVA